MTSIEALAEALDLTNQSIESLTFSVKNLIKRIEILENNNDYLKKEIGTLIQLIRVGD